MQTTSTAITFSTLLDRALAEPGILSRAYTAFHGYSIGNQLLALVQCLQREIEPGPIATFMGWKAKGRSVRKGEHAVVLCMPVTCSRRPAESDEADVDQAPATFTRFIYKPHWFVVSQTEGATVEAPTIPAWSRERALEALGVTEIPFTLTDGNCQGFARQRSIAVSPVAALPHKTRFHELAHVVLGHTAEGGLRDDERTPYSLGEVEAEAVALICLEALGLPGAEFCRGYMQLWDARRENEAIPERSARKIFKAADAILRAGRELADEDQLAA